MLTRVEFKSTAFPKYPDEDAETVNANCWGKRLAEYVDKHLPRHGVETGGILCEDWGWLVSLVHKEFPLWVGCGVMEEPDEDGDEDEPARHAMPPSTEPRLPEGVNEFIMFVSAEPGFFKKLFRKVNTAPAVDRAVQGLKAMMAADPGAFQEVQWSN